jgi:L-alanine-DL-glutamate epimerase-like enolase superfamily enzyme
MIEWRRFDQETTTYDDAFPIKHRRLLVPEGPGLGIDPDVDVIGLYRRR